MVEGKYDKIKLSNFIDAFIVTTDGFSIFKNKEKIELLRLLARDKGIIIMTDSDSGGNLIRSHLKGIINDGKIIQVYVPLIKGKEKRKNKNSAEGYLGVEGLSEGIITDALKRAGIIGEIIVERQERQITKALLYEMGLSGNKDSEKKRKEIYSFLKLPGSLSPNAFLEYINRIYTIEQFKGVCEKCLKFRDNK